jgi:DNA-binding CsgD family transcriptional regulator
MASASEQAARDRAILAARVAGQAPAEIARRHNLTPTRVRQIVAANLATLADERRVDPVQVAFQRRAEYEELLEKAWELADAIPIENPSPKVGALRLTLLALDRVCAWDQIIGVLPGAPHQIPTATDDRDKAEEVVRVLTEEGVSDTAQERLVQVLREPPSGSLEDVVVPP